jgi:aryl-alcohol dehydrogenase-like predicted oxidoreductase
MQTRTLGTNGLTVSKIGFGCMGIDFGYSHKLSKEDGIALIRQAADRGVTFFDTAEVYGPFSNEIMVGEALAPYRGKVVIATKFGFNIQADGILTMETNSRPEKIRQACEGSLSAPR